MNLPLAPGATPESGLPQGRFNGRLDFQQLVRDAMATAGWEGWAEIILSDARCADWPMGERVVEASLQAWAKSGWRLTLLACGYDEVVRRRARFLRWRNT